MASYYELLKHPLWQKKRLEILDLADFTCRECGSKEKTLHVHHTYYEKGKKPWEYPSESLKVLCVDCHRDVEKRNVSLQQTLRLLDPEDQDPTEGYILGIYAYKEQDTLIGVNTYEHAQGIADWWGLTPEIIIDNLHDGETSGRQLLNLVAVHGSPRKKWLADYGVRKLDA